VSPQWPTSFRFPHQNPVHASPSLIRSTCSAHLIILPYSSLCNLLKHSDYFTYRQV
jgi:hypothetical protein